MIIDIHTHIFPEKIAKKTIEYLSEKGGIPPFSDGSFTGLLSEMEKGGVSIAINLPVVTAPRQFESINSFAADINASPDVDGARIISFAGIHPRCEDIEGKMKFIAESGFIGVKLHPDYQETFIDDEGYVEILECAKKYDLVVVTHAGVDGGYRGCPVRCTPDRVKGLIDRVGYGKFVLAHMGANERAEEVIDTLCGLDVYFDTAYVLRNMSRETFMRMLEKHGADRILFASDSPWSSIEGDVKIIKSFGLGKEIEDKIFYENAKGLLGI